MDNRRVSDRVALKELSKNFRSGLYSFRAVKLLRVRHNQLE